MIKPTKLENPWAVRYIGNTPYSIGFVTAEVNGTVETYDSENQRYSPSHWSPKNIRRFPTIQSAITCYIETGGRGTFEEKIERLAKDFPSEFEHCLPLS